MASPSHGAGSLKWQRARLVLDQHQRRPEVVSGTAERVLPVRAELADLLPLHGLRRGSTVVVRGSTTVLLALLAEATAGGSWAAVVGMPDLGVLAAAELGVAIPRLALVPNPGPDYPDVVAALLDGIDLVAVTPPDTRRGPDLAHRLSARARHRKSVLLVVGNWPGADLELNCADTTWSGLGKGHGHLTTQEITVTTRGRGVASRPTSNRITLPSTPAPPATIPTPLRVVRPTEVPTPPEESNIARLPSRLGEVGLVGTSGLSGEPSHARLLGPLGEVGSARASGLSGKPNMARLPGPPGDVGPVGLAGWSGPTEPADPAEWLDPAWLASLDSGRRCSAVEAG